MENSVIMYSPRVTFFLQWNTKEDILKNGDNQTVLMTDTETFLIWAIPPNG